MIDVSWEIDGRKLRPDQIADELERALFKSVRDELVRKVGNIRDPETGMPPSLRVIGRSLENLSISIEGSAAIIAEVRRRLGA